MDQTKKQEPLLISDTVDVFGLGVFEMVCISVRHDSRNVVIAALLLRGVRGDIEGDVLRVSATCQELSVVIATSIY